MTRCHWPQSSRSIPLAACLGALALSWAACGPSELAVEVGVAGNSVTRSGPFGSLRDFVLLRRPGEPAGEALLVDRFEVTQADWAEFTATRDGRLVAADSVRSELGSALPASGMDLFQARRFAHWRLGRLPSEEEWQRATVGGGRSVFPWGEKEFATHANTGDLGLGEATPVGTFESGRRAGGNEPYDLIGNVREWTETVPPDWCRADGLSVGGSLIAARRAALRLRAVSCWSRLGLLPMGVIAAAGGGAVPRKVVGADFQTPMRSVIQRRFDTQLAGERRQRTGMRVYTTVGELIDRLMSLQQIPGTKARLQLERFVSRPGHREALTKAFAHASVRDAVVIEGSVADVFVQELCRVPVEPR